MHSSGEQCECMNVICRVSDSCNVGHTAVQRENWQVPRHNNYYYFMSFEGDELDGKYSLIGCRTMCVLLCMMLSCLAHVTHL